MNTSTTDQKRTRGRPPGSTAAETLDGQVRVRCLLAEKGEWVRASRAADKSLSDWLRELANQAVGGEVV